MRYRGKVNKVKKARRNGKYFGMLAENQNYEDSRDSRVCGLALQTRMLLGNGSVTVT
jgi:hypothetical protein